MKRIISVLAVLAVIIAIVVLGSNKTKGELTFGLIAGTTGDYAIVGESFNKGALLAQEEWNKTHSDMQISVISENDGFDAKKGLSAYQKLVNVDKVDGIVSMTTVTIDAVYDLAVSEGIPFALGFEQGIEAKKDNIVQLWPGTVPAEKKLGEYVKSQGYKNIVIFVDNGSSAFQRFADGFKDGYELPATEIKIAADGTDIRTNALKAVSLKPDAFVFIIKPTSGALLVKEINSISESKPQFIFDANVQTGFGDYEKVLGDTTVLDGSIVYTIPTVYRNEFTEAYKNKYGAEPAIGSETGYNAFMLLASTYDKDKESWVKNMQNAQFDGADGKIVFDENGIRIPELKIGTIENGKLPE